MTVAMHKPKKPKPAPNLILPYTCKELYKWTIRKDGYDAMGSYWGVGAPVFTFRLYFPSGNQYHCDNAIRAKNKTEAKRKIKAMWPSVTRFIND